MTGESEPVEKISSAQTVNGGPTDLPNMVFMGSSVVSGSTKCVVTVTGDRTMFGAIAKDLASRKREPTSFEKGVNSVSWVLIKFMAVMVPVVLFLNGFARGDWLEALLFAISVGVGLTPEMLPMIVTTCLAKGAVTRAVRRPS